jgi:hypothetical protein
MRKALLAGALLGAIVGLVFVHHDVLRLSVAWPVILGIALWETVGDRGSRGVLVGAAAVVGAAAGWVAFAVPGYYMPLTDLSVGIVAGVLVAVIVAGGLLAGDRFPLSAMLIGFGAFFGVFEPLWRESPANLRLHGVENLTVVWLGLLLGILSTALVRALTEGVGIKATDREKGKEETVRLPEASDAPLSEMLEGGASE